MYLTFAFSKIRTLKSVLTVTCRLNCFTSDNSTLLKISDSMDRYEIAIKAVNIITDGGWFYGKIKKKPL